MAFNADVWSPGSDGLRWDAGYTRQWLDMAVEDGLARDAIVVGTHGSSANGTSTTEVLRSLIDITGYNYPNLTARDWRAGGALC